MDIHWLVMLVTPPAYYTAVSPTVFPAFSPASAGYTASDCATTVACGASFTLAGCTSASTLAAHCSGQRHRACDRCEAGCCGHCG